MFGPKPLQLACNCKRWRDFLMRSDRFGLVFCRAESHTVRHAHAHCVALRGAATEPPKRAMFIQWDYPRRNPTLSTAPRATAPVRSNRGERERGGDGRRSVLIIRGRLLGRCIRFPSLACGESPLWILEAMP